MERLPDSYALLPEAQSLVKRLQLLPEFAHTKDAYIVCILSQPTVMLRGSPCRAFIGEPKVQGPLRNLLAWFLAGLAAPVLDGQDPEFIVMVDAAEWSTLDATRRERLIYHELKHLQVKENPETGEPRLHEDGRYQLRTVPHDYEVFSSEVRRYGAEVTEIEELCDAIVEGQKRAKRRRGSAA